MEVLRLRKRAGFDPKPWLHTGPRQPRRAVEEDVSTIVESGVQVRDADTDEHVLTFIPVEGRDPAPLLAAVSKLRFQENYRTEGLKSRSCTFGFQPRIPLRRDFCSVAASAYVQPREHSTLIDYGRWTARVYESLLPREYAVQQTELEQVLPEWREPGTHFTSGIANDRNVLHYHRDAGNFPNALSTMLSLARNMGDSGGKLLVPEYDVGLSFHGFELLIFNGSALVHGVTPITIHSADSYRYTIVYYALQSMSRCGTKQEELQRIRKLKTKRELQRTSENEAELKARLIADVGLDEETVKRMGERKAKNFSTRTRKAKK